MSDKKDLLVLLKAESPRTAADLAKALDVTSRTIYRWVDKLIEEGHPIYSTTGRAGGIGLDLDGSVRASMLSANTNKVSSSTTKVAKDSKAAKKNKGSETSESDDDFSIEAPKLHFLSEEKNPASEKPDASVSAPVVSTDRLSDDGPVYADWIEIDFSKEEIEFKIDKKYVICKEAIFTHHVLNFTYHLPQGKMLICSTEPVKFFLHDGQWHILAWVRQVEKFKVFQLLNMTELQIGPERHNRTADFSIQQAMNK